MCMITGQDADDDGEEGTSNGRRTTGRGTAGAVRGTRHPAPPGLILYLFHLTPP